MKLTAFLIGTQKAIIDIASPTEAQMAGNPYMKWEETVSFGYADVSSILNLDAHYFIPPVPFLALRNELITTFLPNWATATIDEKKTLVRWYVYPSTATQAELNALYAQTQRDAYRDVVMENLNIASNNFFSVWKDSTNGNFYKAVTQNGTTLTTFITTNQIL